MLDILYLKNIPFIKSFLILALFLWVYYLLSEKCPIILDCVESFNQNIQ